MFKEIVKSLFELKEGKSFSPIWNVFRNENSSLISLKETLRRIPDHICFKNDILYKLEAICTNSDLFDAFREEDDTFWEKLFLILRDLGCEEIQIRREKLVSVHCAGEERQLTLADLEENILEDYGDILHTQTAIPDTILFEEDKKMLMYDIKRVFESQTTGKSDYETKNIFSQIKKSSEAKCIKDIQSLEAEFYVQNKLIELGREKCVSMIVLRGIKSYGYVGKFLEGFGLKFSKLRYLYLIFSFTRYFLNSSSLLNNKENADLETDHDVMALTISGRDLTVIFIQVGIFDQKILF